MKSIRSLRPRDAARRKTLTLACAAGAFASGWPLSAAAQTDAATALDEVVVSASRTPVAADRVGAAVTVVTRDQIEDRQVRTLSDVLRSVPGVAVSRTGPEGAVTQVRLRGAEGNHTLVRIDGVEVNSASGNEFDFANLLAADVDRIEILRGPQSALYGSDSIGGVIDIRTIRGRGEPSVSGFIEGGSFGTASGAARVGMGTDLFDVALKLNGRRTAGINISDFGNEKDGARTMSGSLTGAVRPFDFLEFDGVLSLSDAKASTDDQDFAFPATATQGLVIDTDDETKTRRVNGRVGAELTLFDDAWTQRFDFSGFETESKSEANGLTTRVNTDEKIKATYQSTFDLSTPAVADAEHSFTLAYEFEQKSFESENAQGAVTSDFSTRENSFVGEYRVDLFERISLSGAVRHDRKEDFQNATTYRAAASVRFPETGTRLHGGYATGVADPTLTELFGFAANFTPNPNLEPEESRSFDVGVEQSLFDDRLVFDLTYFNATLEKEIGTNFDGANFSPVNQAGTSKRQGFEFTTTAEVLENLDVSFTYAYLDANGSDDRGEVRRARHIGGLNIAYRFLEDRANVNLDIQYNGKQEDLEFINATPQTRETLRAFTLVDIAGGYEIADGVEVTGRIENLLNQEYEEVFGYNAPGIGGYAGVKVRF